jgi:hypothetical protein
MRIRRYLKGLIFFATLLVFLAGFFWVRSPVLIVTDNPFNALYGVSRTWKKQLDIAFKLFRRVKVVTIAESIGPDMVSFAVEEAAPAPYSVIFPYRYYEGAIRYGEQFPHIPVLILGGRVREAPAEGEPFFFRTGTETDFYRAGLCAGLFVINNGENRGNGENILFFQDEQVSETDRAAFISGLREQGLSGEPVFLSTAGNYTAYQDIFCVVMTGRAPSFLDQNLRIPIILFSWVDPVVSPTSVKVIFDDSPWALAVPGIKMAVQGKKSGELPSEMIFPAQRIPDKGILQTLKKVVYYKMF